MLKIDCTGCAAGRATGACTIATLSACRTISACFVLGVVVVLVGVVTVGVDTDNPNPANALAMKSPFGEPSPVTSSQCGSALTNHELLPTVISLNALLYWLAL